MSKVDVQPVVQLSKNKCPVCGGNEWIACYLGYYSREAVPLTSSVDAIVDVTCVDLDGFDFCVNCETGITSHQCEARPEAVMLLAMKATS